MSESTNSLISSINTQENEEIYINETKEMILSIVKFVSFCILILVAILQFECLLVFILKLITNDNTFLMHIIMIFSHIILLRYFVQSFLFILQSPILKSLCFYAIACNQLRELFDTSNDYINLYKKLKNQNNTFDRNKIIYIEEVSNTINAYMIFFREIKINNRLTKEQNELYDKLSSWMSNYEEYKKNEELNLKNKEKDNNKDEQKTFIYYLRKMRDDSKDICKILNNFMCSNSQTLSIKRLYNIFINNSFSSLSQYSFLFKQKFNNKSQTFITSDNKIIDYTIISYNKLNIIYRNKPNRNLNKNDNNKRSENLLIFCNPNGMIYQLFSPEKFLYLLEGGCDVLLWNYRGYGYSTGHSTFKNAKTDIIELFDYIKQKKDIKNMGRWDIQ